MKCNDFEDVIYDLARNQIVDASLRQKALVHIKGCAECEARLEEQRSITNGLRAMAEGFKEAVPSSHVETSLIESFRRLNQDVTPVNNEAKLSAEKSIRHNILRYAAAAAILLILGLAVWQLEGLFSKENREQATDRNITDQPSPSQKDEPKSETRPEENKPTVADSRQQKRINKSRRTTNEAAQRVAQNKSSDSASAKREIATEFIPLVDLDDISEMDRGRLLRVQLPRSTLLNFGLPVNAARASEPLMADVLIGDDGFARAIRFVR